MKKFSDFREERKQVNEESEYQKFFNKKLDEYGVDSPAELSDEEAKKFFNEVDKEWNADDE